MLHVATVVVVAVVAVADDTVADVPVSETVVAVLVLVTEMVVSVLPDTVVAVVPVTVSVVPVPVPVIEETVVAVVAVPVVPVEDVKTHELQSTLHCVRTDSPMMGRLQSVTLNRPHANGSGMPLQPVNTVGTAVGLGVGSAVGPVHALHKTGHLARSVDVTLATSAL